MLEAGKVERYRLGIFMGLLLAATNSTFAAFSIVTVKDSDGTYAAIAQYDSDSKAAAEKLAIASCSEYAERIYGKKITKSSAGKQSKEEKCQFLYSGDGPGYIAIVKSLPGKPATLGYGVSLNRQEAINRAYAGCVENQHECSQSADFVVWDGGPTKQPPPQVQQEQHIQATGSLDLEDRLRQQLKNSGPRSGYSKYRSQEAPKAQEQP